MRIGVGAGGGRTLLQLDPGIPNFQWGEGGRGAHTIQFSLKVETERPGLIPSDWSQFVTVT